VALVALAIAVSVAAGAGAQRRWGARAQAVTRRMLDVALYVVLPFITFFVIARTEFTVGVSAGLGLAVAQLCVVGVLAWLAATRLLHLQRTSAGVVVVACIVVNTGYLGIPLNAALLGTDAIGPAVAFDTVVSGPMLYVVAFAVGAACGTRGDTPRERTRAFFTRNPPLLALAAALVAPDALAPQVLADGAELLAIALLPVGFFVLGVTLAAEADGGALRVPPPLTRPIATVLGLRLLVAPGLMLALSTLVAGVPDAYLLQAAMPSGINTLVVAHAYGLDLRLAAGAVAWSTLVVVVAALGSLAW
jgi:predicted permease